LFRLEYHRRLGELKTSRDPEQWRDLAEWLEKSRAAYVGPRWVREARDRVRELELERLSKDDVDGYLALAKKLEKNDGAHSAYLVLEVGLKNNPAGKPLIEKLMTLEVKGRVAVLEQYYEALKVRAEENFDAAAFAEFGDWCSLYSHLDTRIKDWVLHCHTRAVELEVFSAPDAVEGVEGTAAGSEREPTGREVADEENSLADEAIFSARRLAERPLDRYTFQARIPQKKRRKKALKATNIELLLQKHYRLIKGGVRTYASSPPGPNDGFAEVWNLEKRPGPNAASAGQRSTEPVWVRVKWDPAVSAWQEQTEAEKQQVVLEQIEFVKAQIDKLLAEVSRGKAQLERQVRGMEKVEAELRTLVESGADEKKIDATRKSLLRASRGVFKAKTRLGKREFKVDAWTRALSTLDASQ
jgi:hypothetical protein